MTTPVLTDRQNRIVEFIRVYTKQNRYSPSIREVGAAVGLVSVSSTAYQLSQLEAAGELRFSAKVPRSIVLLNGPCAHCCVSDKPSEMKPRHRWTLQAIRDHLALHGQMPNPEQLERALNVSPGTLANNLGALEAQGWIRRVDKKTTRSRLELTDKVWPVTS